VPVKSVKNIQEQRALADAALASGNKAKGTLPKAKDTGMNKTKETPTPVTKNTATHKKLDVKQPLSTTQKYVTSYTLLHLSITDY
jgi:hypothetical protein